MPDQKDPMPASSEISRRDFVQMSIAAGIAVAGGATLASAQMAVVETDVTIMTPDGSCDAAFIHPATGMHPAVLIWPDAFGLRPSMRDMGKRLAAEGYSVLVPNPYYRVRKAPFVENASTFNFGDPAQRATLTPLMGSINAPGAVERDATAFIAWLDGQPQVDRNRKVGTQGYCMGGPMALRASATMADRIGAVASFHGGTLVTNMPDSPHLAALKSNAQFLIAIAANDDMRAPMEKDVLKEAFAKANRPAEIEVYAGAAHGWCPPDSGVYNEPQAEKAWSRLLALYEKAL